MDFPSDVDLLLIGKTGNGKSATGNSILGRKAFKSKSTSGNITKEVDFDVTNFNGKIIKVVDGPGIGDTRMDNKEAEDLVKRTMEYAITANPHGYHAFLLVFRFGSRFTSEDRDTIACLKAIFGDNVFKSFGILILTCGDHFEMMKEEEEVSFEEWVQQQEGVFQDFVQECNGRVLLFNNKTKDDVERDAQITKLLDLVENLQSKGIRYTDENFVQARETQQCIIIDSKKPMIEEKTLIETSLILEKINQAQQIKDSQHRADDLANLLVRVDSLATSVQTQDRGTGALKDLIANVKSVKDFIKGEIKRLDKVQKRELERQEKQEEWKQNGAEEKGVNEKERKEHELEWGSEMEIKELRQKLEKLEHDYYKIKQNYNKSLFDKVVDKVTWPLELVTSWIYG